MIDNLIKEFEKVYFSHISSTKGIENLAKNIGISKNSLRRFLGKIKSDSNLRISTLNLIAERMGYHNFQDFCESHGRKYTLDFTLLEIYYGTVKGQEPSLSENRFQKANYYFAEKIISDPENLKEFVKRFAQNEEALEYVLAWHPSYEKIAQKSYQHALNTVAKISTKAHIKVFAQAFIYFGRFMSEEMELQESGKLLNQLKKSVHRMRLESNTFHAFPEARFMVAKCIDYKMRNDTQELSAELRREIAMHHVTNATFRDRFIYRTFVTNILNILQDYDNADLCFKDQFSDKEIVQFEAENPAYRVNIFLYRVNRAITLYHLGRKDEAVKIFNRVTENIHDAKTFSFDSKPYFELNYFYLAKKIFPARQDYQRRYDMLVDQMNFIYLIGR